VLSRYSNRAISTAQVIEELIGLAKSIRSEIEHGRETGEQEVAFYEALADNKSAREVLRDNTLRIIARELEVEAFVMSSRLGFS
jgi:type I restriction enzyme R subunit